MWRTSHNADVKLVYDRTILEMSKEVAKEMVKEAAKEVAKGPFQKYPLGYRLKSLSGKTC